MPKRNEDEVVRMVISRAGPVTEKTYTVSYEYHDQTIASEYSIDEASVRKHITIYLSGHLPSGVSHKAYDQARHDREADRRMRRE